MAVKFIIVVVVGGGCRRGRGGIALGLIGGIAGPENIILVKLICVAVTVTISIGDVGRGGGGGGGDAKETVTGGRVHLIYFYLWRINMCGEEIDAGFYVSFCCIYKILFLYI